MALEGSLKDFGLADILQLIYFQRKTGVLTLDGKMDKVRLLFIDGNISGAESKRRIEDNRLGKILLKKGHIKEPDLKIALDEQQNTGNKLGNILMQKGLADKEIIQDILKNQITETVIQIFEWKLGTYEFTSQGVPQDKEFSFSIDTQHLLMEGLRIVDEWSLIKGKLTLETVFLKKPDTDTVLAADESEILSYVDGENDVSTIIDLSARDNFEVSKTLLSLVEKGVIEAAESAPVVAEKPSVIIKKPSVSLSYLPVAAIVVSVLISFAAVFLQQGNTMKTLRAAQTIQDMRFRAETYRLENSTYPMTLELISQQKDPWGRPYIYSTSDNSFFISSTGADGQEGTTDDIY